MIKPAERATAVCRCGYRRLRRLDNYRWLWSWGLRPRLYADARSARSQGFMLSPAPQAGQQKRRREVRFHLYRSLQVLAYQVDWWKCQVVAGAFVTRTRFFRSLRRRPPTCSNSLLSGPEGLHGCLNAQAKVVQPLLAGIQRFDLSSSTATSPLRASRSWL